MSIWYFICRLLATIASDSHHSSAFFPKPTRARWRSALSILSRVRMTVCENSLLITECRNPRAKSTPGVVGMMEGHGQSAERGHSHVAVMRRPVQPERTRVGHIHAAL